MVFNEEINVPWHGKWQVTRDNHIQRGGLSVRREWILLWIASPHHTRGKDGLAFLAMLPSANMPGMWTAGWPKTSGRITALDPAYKLPRTPPTFMKRLDHAAMLAYVERSVISICRYATESEPGRDVQLPPHVPDVT